MFAKGSDGYKEMLKRYEKEIWQRHPDESADQYYFFFQYYLRMPRAGRNVTAAYQNLLVKERGLSRKEASTYRAGGTHGNWSRGKDTQGNTIEGLHTFVERAAAYDEWVFEDERNKFLAKRGQLLDEEARDGVRLLDNWKLLMGDFERQYDAEKSEAQSNGKIFKAGGFMNNFKGLIRSREEVAVFLRRSVGMMDKVTEDILMNQIENAETIILEWKEPEIKPRANETDEEIAINNLSSEDFELLINE